MKSTGTELWLLCLPGVMVWCFLCVAAEQNLRARLITAVPMLGILIAALLLLNALWQREKASLFLRGALVLFLLYSAAQGVASLWQSYNFFYPQGAAHWAVLFCAFVPILYLRRHNSMQKTALLVAGGAALCLGIGLASLASKLHLANLAQAVTVQDLKTSAQGWLFFPIDFAVPILLSNKNKAKSSGCAIVWLALTMGTLLAGSALVLRLYYGDAQQLLAMPHHMAFSGGELGVFTRLDWLQLLWWSLAIPVRTAVLFEAIMQVMPLEKCFVKACFKACAKDGVGEKEATGTTQKNMMGRGLAVLITLCVILTFFLQAKMTQGKAAAQALNIWMTVCQWGWVLWAIIECAAKGQGNRGKGGKQRDAIEPPNC